MKEFVKTHIYASVDIGSNAVRLLINYIYERFSKNPIFNKASLVRVPVRLGEDAFTTGIISEKNIQRLSDAVIAMDLIINLYNVEHKKIFATSALRESLNKKEVVEQVRKKSGVLIEIIDGETEAKIILKNHLNEFKKYDLNYLYVDVGGGSTEISLIHNGDIVNSLSFKAGTVRFLSNPNSIKVLETEIKPFIKKVIKDKPIELIGSGGNINFLFKYSRNRDGVPLSYNELCIYLKEFSQVSYKKRIEQFNMNPDRADVIIPALNIFVSIMRWSKAKRIHIPKIGTADGMIQYLFQNNKK